MLTAIQQDKQADRLLEDVDFYRLDINRKLSPKARSALGQFMTSAPVAKFMASCFSQSINGHVRLLDAGAGVGSLTAAFIKEAIQRENRPDGISVTAYELEPVLIEYLISTLEKCRRRCEEAGIQFSSEVLKEDFIYAGANILKGDLFSDSLREYKFTHAILNPPYKKIRSDSDHRRLLRSIGIETSNLYTGFLSIAVLMLDMGGELVAIVPRSFCNGPYFKPFRQFFLNRMALKHLHVFESRDQTFRDEDVLQENIIFQAVKGGEKSTATISSSSGPDFNEMTVQEVDYDQIVKPDDPNLFIHITTSKIAQYVLDRIHIFNHTLGDIDIEVSTGPVVDFRLKDYLRDKQCSNTVPLIYPSHFQGNYIVWPNYKGRKPNAIVDSEESAKWLMPNGYYTVVRRFSSKEEKRRIVAAVHDPNQVAGKKIGFENHLNVFHTGRSGLSPDLARGLAVYLNSTLIDIYFRQFNGHTQVNATDLKMLRYPCQEVLESLGASVDKEFPTQNEIDELLEQEIRRMADIKTPDPVRAKQKIDEALEILKLLGLPRAQQNERSALTLLALLNLRPENPWPEAKAPLIGITPIMEFCRDFYGKNYAPNTRETFRRQTMHQFMEAGLSAPNPDKPDRPVNSPKWCYQIAPDALELLQAFGTPAWNQSLSDYLRHRETLREKYARLREMQKIPVTFEGGQEVQLSPGKHSELIKAIIDEFAPRYAPGGRTIYIGDTGDKWGYFDKEGLEELGVVVDTHGKMPDVVIYHTRKNWLLLIEAVTSHGPVDAKRRDELSLLFKGCSAGLVYVTAFLSRTEMSRYLRKISWETEVWVAEAPSHLIHFDGDRFRGPYD